MRAHFKSILSELDANSRTRAVHIGFKRGIIALGVTYDPLRASFLQSGQSEPA